MIEQAGTAHGLSLWLESELLPGVYLSKAPDQPHNPIYSQQFFPWSQPVDLAPGDRIDVTLQTKRVENRYEWLWATTIHSAEGSAKARFRQYTFNAQAWTPEMLRKQMPTHAPKLNAQGVLNRFILSQVDGQHTVAEIAAIVAAHYPERFASSSAALPWVSDVVQQYCT